MRIALFLVILTLCFMSLSANLVENKATEYTQPDGTKLNLFVSGDEYYHRVHDERGYTILLHPETGFAVYAIPDGNSITSSNYVVGTVDPASLGIQPNLFKSDESIERRFQEQLQNANNSNRGSPTGTFNNVVCFIRFSDQSEFPTSTTYTWYNNLFNSTSQQSLADYYDEVSQGQLDINSYLYSSSGSYIVSIQVSHTRGYYSPYNVTTNPDGYSTDAQATSREWALITELCGLVDPLVPNSIDLDTDDDSINDGLTFIIRGPTDDWGDILWSAHVSWSGSPGSINGVPIWHYVKDFEGGLGASVICHEMGHMIGFPDLYHYTNNGITPVGQWSLMASDNTQHETTYEKWKYGTWFSTIPTITPSSTPTQYTLTSIDQNPYSCYKIASSQANEYYMLEYRRDTGRYESGIPGSGLIIYRVMSSFGGTPFNGNAAGPPDEIYVYRPSGTISVNGTIGSANYSSTAGRTAIHNFTNPKPWLYSSTHTSLDGNLVITDVGASGGTTITFTVRNSAPNVWDGSTSTAWDTASNWSLNSVPTSTQDVEIPSSPARQPVVSTITPACKTLLVSSGASITISTGTLHVTEDANIFGTLVMSDNAANLYVGADLFFQSGSSTLITAAAEIYVTSDVEFLAGSNVNMANGYLDFSGTGTSYIRCYTATTIYHLRSHKSSGTFGFSSVCTAPVTINGSFWTYNGSTSTCYYSGTTILKGSLNSYTGGLVTFLNGTLSFEGSASSSINFVDAGNFLNNLTINKTGASVVLSTATALNGNLTIQSGVFNPANYTLSFGGSWVNSVGPTAFIEGTGTVVLNGVVAQTMSTETFNILELNKSAASMSIPSGASVTCASYNWTAGAINVSGGSFTVADLADAGIFGTITLSSGTINYTQDASSFIDLRASLTISGGTFNVFGGSGAAWFSYIDAASLTLSGSGVLDIKDQGIYLPDGSVFNDTITGGTIKTSQYFNVQRADFNPTGGTIELYGSTDAMLTNTAGSNFYNIKINKAVTREGEDRSLPDYVLDREGNRIPLTRSNTVTGVGPLDINGSFTIQAGVFVAPATINIAGYWINQVGPAAFTEGTGSVEFDGSAHQYCNYSEEFATVIINKSGGALRVNNASATVSCATYTWTAGSVDVLLGTFTANDLSQNGIYGNFFVNPNATINLHQGTDQYVDLDGFFYLTGGGTINVYGGSLSSDFAWDANAGITMSGGVIDFKDKGININSRPSALTLNITGGTLRTIGSFYSVRSGVVFAGGEVELYGPGDNYVNMGASSHFYNLRINKSVVTRSGDRTALQIVKSHDREEIIDLRASSISANTNLQINGSLNIQNGSFDVNSKTISVYNDLDIWGTLKMIAAGVLDIDDDVNWNSGSISNVSTGTIYCGGSWFFASGCNVDLTGSTTRIDNYYGGYLTNNSPTAKFGNLEIYGTEEDPETDYVYNLGTNILLVSGNLTVYGTNTLNLNEGSCTVSGFCTINETATINVGDGGTLTINGNLELHGSLITGPGSAIVHGAFYTYSTGSLSVNQGIFKNDAPWADPFVISLAGAVNITSGVFEITDKSLSIMAHATRVFSNATVKVGKGFTASTAGSYLPTGTNGGLYLIGSGNPVLQASGGNYLTNFYLQKSGSTDTAYLQADIIITGNVNITGGKLNTVNHNMSVGGNWTNSVGTAAFVPGTATVSFNKAGSLQSVTGSNNFNNVTDNHTGSALDFQGATGISGTLTVNNIVTFQNTATLANVSNAVASGIMAFYGSHISTIAAYNGGGAIRSFSGSWVNIADLVQSGLYGSWTADNGHLELHQDISSWIDVNGPVLIQNNGIIDIYGGNMDIYFAYAGNASLTMSSGEFNVKNRGIYIPNSAYTSSFNVSGGSIRINGNWNDARGNFIPTGGTVEFNGSADAIVTVTAPSYFHHFLVNKAAAARNDLEPEFQTNRDGSTTPITRAQDFGNTSIITINGNFTIQNVNVFTQAANIYSPNAGNVTITAGTLLVQNLLRTTGNVSVNGSLKLGANGILELANNKALTVNNGALLEAIGTFTMPVKITHNSTGYYALNIESGGTISADNAIFEYMNSSGINIKNGALVDPINSLNNCVFRNSNSGGKLLTINNNQTFDIDNAEFPNNTWSGSYNVSKTVNQGNVTFNNYSGSFGGSAFEQDSYNRIAWLGSPIVSDLTISYISVSNRINLSWSYPYPYNSFKIYRCLSPYGTFTEVGTSVSTSWSEISSGDSYFYRVTAVTTP